MTKTASSASRPDICVFIGRFQPFHVGHAAVIREALERADRTIVLVGSAHQPRTPHNPFTATERARMILDSFDHDPRLVVLPLEDSDYNLNDWLERVSRTVERVWQASRQAQPDLPESPRVALIGHAKDASSYYLKLFPQWSSIDVPQDRVLSATQIRQAFFNGGAPCWEDDTAMLPQLTARVDAVRAQALHFLAQDAAAADPLLPKGTARVLADFVRTETFTVPAMEVAHASYYRYLWRHAPHTPLFVTTDAVVVQSGHVLLVKRRNFPGKGLWALPGGFLEADETIEQGMLRELDEETGLRVPPAVLRGHIRSREVFDAPNRSSRGRTITHAFLIHLEPGALPKVKTGGQEGETSRVAWVPLSQISREQFFEDHYSIIANLTARI